jgi:hypothetical protein
MKILSSALLIILIIAAGLGVSVGIDIKKWYGWMQVVAGFFLGMFIGQNLAEKIIIGILFAFTTLLLGLVIWRRRHR